MNENVDSALGISSEAQDTQNNQVATRESCASASRLRTLVNIILFLQVLFIPVLFITTFTVEVPGIYRSRTEFNPMCIAYCCSSLLSSLILWGFGHAIADIVDNTAHHNPLPVSHAADNIVTKSDRDKHDTKETRNDDASSDMDSYCQLFHQ